MTDSAAPTDTTGGGAQGDSGTSKAKKNGGDTPAATTQPSKPAPKPQTPAPAPTPAPTSPPAEGDGGSGGVSAPSG